MKHYCKYDMRKMATPKPFPTNPPYPKQSKPKRAVNQHKRMAGY